MKFSLACASIVFAPVIVGGKEVVQSDTSSSKADGNSITIKDVIDSLKKNGSSPSSSYKKSSVYRRLENKRNLRNAILEEVRNEPTKLTNKNEGSGSECSPAVNVSKATKLDAGDLPSSSCSSNEQVCLAHDSTEPSSSSSNEKKTGVCVPIDAIPSSYWDTAYGSPSTPVEGDEPMHATVQDSRLLQSGPATQQSNVPSVTFAPTETWAPSATFAPTRTPAPTPDWCFCDNARPVIPQDKDFSDIISECMMNIKSEGDCSYGPIECWDTSEVTDMSYAFYNQGVVPDVYCWDTSRVTNMESMFSNTTYFKSWIDIWDVGKVKNFNSMFFNADYFNYSLSSWDTSSATDMAYMFEYANAFNQDISQWTTSSVEDLSFTFFQAAKFNQNLNSWDTSAATSMNHTFYSAPVFNSPLNNWSTGKVTNMAYMFSKAGDFNMPIDGWDVSKVETLEGMFSGALSYDEYGEYNYNYQSYFNQDINGWDISKVTSTAMMFYFSASVYDHSLSNWDTGNVVDMHSMFEGAYYFDANVNDFNVNKVQNMSSMFYYTSSFGRSGLTDINGWNTASVVDMTAMFGVTKFFDQPLDGWNVRKVTTMTMMFLNSTFNQPVDAWDVDSVNDMGYMFDNDYVFNQCLSTWADKTPKDVNTTSMFYGSSCPGEITPVHSESPWCQTFNDGCGSDSGPAPIFCKTFDFKFIFSNGKEKMCTGLLNRFVAPPGDPTGLEKACKETMPTTDPYNNDDVFVSDACPTFCDFDRCCQIDNDIEFLVPKNKKTLIKKCGGLLNKFLEDPTGMEEQCNLVFPTVSGGNVLVKEACTGFCDPNCPKEVECKDKEGFSLTDKDGTFKKSCKEFFQKEWNTKENKDTLKEVCKAKTYIVNEKDPDNIKTINQPPRKICPLQCVNLCKNVAADFDIDELFS